MALVDLPPANPIQPTGDGRLDGNPAAVYLARLSTGSRRTMRQALDTIAGLLSGTPDALSFPWSALKYQHIAAIRSKLADTYAPATASKMLCAVRGVLWEAWRLELIPEADFRRAVDVKGVRGEALPTGRALTGGEIASLMGACAKDRTTAGARDAAMIALLYAGGLRRAEVCGLDVQDLDPRESLLRVRRAKGRKERVVPLVAGATAAAEDWLEARGYAPGPLFVPVDKAGAISIRRLSTQAVYNIIVRRASEAGVDHFSPHDFRRSMISHLLDAGADLVTVSKLAGHAAVTTTARYDRRGDEAKRKAVDMLHVPYRRRGYREAG